MQDALKEQNELDEQLKSVGRKPQGISIERQRTSPDTPPVNGNHSLPDEDEDKEDDLILGNEDELTGEEEEYDVELEDEPGEEDLDEDDLVIDTNEDDPGEDEDL